jgi:formylglycine-generating enzyme required for sulfatase activity
MRPELVTIPAGAFTMGSANGQPDERPQRRVHVDTFALGVHPVTNAEYRRFLTATGHRSPAWLDDARFVAPRQPVVAVDWFDAIAYCAWLASTTGLACRLPTEAEREKAARGGVEGQDYPWGDTPELPNVRPRLDAPAEVGLDVANGYGLHNTGDLVHEWCSDWYGADSYRHASANNPQGPASGHRRVSRGGSWRHQVSVTRCAARSSLPPDRTYADYGFRIAIGGSHADADGRCLGRS